MSYSFNWECTLPISNIQDIVSINIVPNTSAYDEGDYLSVRGQILIDGEYTTTYGTQSTFSEYIPIDITLPNNGRGGEITSDITNFDYDVKDGNNLFLTLNLNLEGYDWDNSVTLVEDNHEELEVEIEKQAPVLFTKEAAISSFGHESSESMTEQDLMKEQKEVLSDSDDCLDDLEYIDFDEVVLDHKEQAIDPALATDRKDGLTEKIKQFITKQPNTIEEESVSQGANQPVSEAMMEQEVPVVETVEKSAQKSKSKALASVVEEGVEQAKSKPLAPIPSVTKVESQVVPVVEEDDEEILPFPLKTESVVEETPVQTKKSDIFDMLYTLDETEPVVEEVEPFVEPVQDTQPEGDMNEQSIMPQQQMVEEVEGDSMVEKPISTYTSEDSVANQFLDGESILKIIFVQEEETTISNICTKYNVPEKSIYNREQLNSPLKCGDRVMINYGKLR